MALLAMSLLGLRPTADVLQMRDWFQMVISQSRTVQPFGASARTTLDTCTDT
jgi:hypothetical protein